MTSRLLISATLLFLASPALAQQKRALDHSDYARWRTVSNEKLSPDGSWAVWREAPDTIGDGRVVARETSGDGWFEIPRGDNPVFADGYLVAIMHAPYDSTRQARMDGAKEDDLPGDSLAVLDLRTGGVTSYGPVRSFKVAKDGAAFAAVLMDLDTETERDSTLADSPHEKQDGRELRIVDFRRQEVHSYEGVIAYEVSSSGDWVVMARESKDGQLDGVIAARPNGDDPVVLLDGEGFYRQLTLDEEGGRVAFVTNTADFEADQPTFSLHVSTLPDAAQAMAREGDPGIPTDWWVSEHGSLEFSESGTRLFFGTAPRPEPEVEDNRPDDEKVPVDIWSWTDKDLMTVQLVNRTRDLERSYRAVLHLDTGAVVQLADETVPRIDDVDTGDAPVVFGITNLPYMPEGSWDTPGWSDVYVIDVATGSRTLILEGIRSGIYPSPSGSYVAWWDGHDLAWKITSWSTSPNSTRTSSISPPEGVRFENELHDTPAIPGSNGQAGWTEDEEWFVFYDRYDLWAARPEGTRWAITSGRGRAAGLRYRIVDLDDETPTLDLAEPLLLSVLDTRTRDAGFARVTIDGDSATITDLVREAVRFGGVEKADDGDALMLTRESYSEFPDLWTTNAGFDTWERLSDANPHQSEYLWGTAELVSWTSTDGEALDGILYKPEGFDPSLKYPMMVYFYERAADGLHAHHTPAPGRSVINRTFYASRGYLVFVPDIPYKEGYPGESAMNAVMPGVTGLIDQGFVDRDRVGVQGHSWGGYQIAYMVTRTNLFAAAEAGAPVPNMTSAYGGIRWQTGLSRMFQYERTQSRIGGTLWEKPLRYIENSPIFWLDKVETPLLIMHNDADGHVPWYQGIELFVALRRLGKPSWLINYNGEPHWPLPYWKRVDWTTRLQQYFDHYLMDAPAPVWLKEGVPAVEKGVTWGFELTPTEDGR